MGHHKEEKATLLPHIHERRVKVAGTNAQGKPIMVNNQYRPSLCDDRFRHDHTKPTRLLGQRIHNRNHRHGMGRRLPCQAGKKADQ